jgi:hypothetical protein
MMKNIKGFILFAFLLHGIIHLHAQPNTCPLPPAENENIYTTQPKTTTSRSMLLYEDFWNGVPPFGWEVQGQGQSNWISGFSNYASGMFPELMFVKYPQISGTSRLVTSAINTTGYTALVFEMKHYINNYSGLYELKIETSGNGTTWNTIWTMPSTGAPEPEIVDVIIENGSVGGEDFQVAITFSGNSFQATEWYVDDIKIFEAVDYDASADDLTVPQFAKLYDSLYFPAVVRNSGTQPISFEAVLEIKQEGTTIFSNSKSINNLPSFAFESETFDPWYANTMGGFFASITVVLEGDQVMDNNAITKEFGVAPLTLDKKPLIEVFTSSTCIYCYDANLHIDNLLSNNPGEYSLIKYQMNWPMSGDPYYTHQNGERKMYYDVTFVPNLYCNGVEVHPVYDLDQEAFNELTDEATPLGIQISAFITEDSVVTVTADIVSFAYFEPGLKLQVAICEKETTGNVGNNGQTEFHNVLMQMLPSTEGIVLERFYVNTHQYFNVVGNLSGTNVEEIDDLVAIVFVQDDNTRQVLQSEMCDIDVSNVGLAERQSPATILIYPNPANNLLNLSVPGGILSFKMTNQTGLIVVNERINKTNFSYDIRNLPSGLYLVELITPQKTITKKVLIY